MHTRASGAAAARMLISRVALFAALWLVLSGGEPGSWVIGVPAVLAAAWARGRLAPDPLPGLSPAGLARFVPVFLWESVRGGVDVAARTLGPRLRVQPGFADYPLSLPPGPPRRFLTACVSLLPGTLAAGLDGERLRVHLIDDRVDFQRDLDRLERAVGRLFRERPHRG